ncbi:S49 family peptidase [Desulfovibrio oxyclinae]|uniref:S49 family peptidase n=1 Tax=Desulfovibrio oxyclinae TaxID=63560 RepID=UPI00035F409E|nr:S49 family peptidase [Desulfovibrio oxyclinae]
MRARRAVTLLANEVWAIAPDKLEQIADLTAALMEGRETGGDIFANLAGESGEAGKAYRVQDGVAVIPVSGVIARRLNMFQSISGGCSTELIAKHVQAARSDDDVRAILLDIDSPGGGVFGLTALAEAIRETAQDKPVVSWSGGLMCSAAYWTGTAGTETWCAPDAEVGSLGVACVHYDRSAGDEKAGVKRTVLSAGRYKRIASDEKPLSEEGREYLQERVDHYYSLFVEAVAQNMGMSVEAVLERLADGSTHIGTTARDKGFVHTVGSFDAALARALELAETHNQEAQAMPTGNKSVAGTEARGGASGALDYSAITAESLATERPDLHGRIMADGHAEGVNAERGRVVEIMGAGVDRTLTLEAVKSGMEPGDFYRQALKTERQADKAALEQFEQNLSDSAGQDGAQKEARTGSGFDELVTAHMAEAGCSRGAALLAVARKNPEAHAAWLAEQNRR